MMFIVVFVVLKSLLFKEYKCIGKCCTHPRTTGVQRRRRADQRHQGDSTLGIKKTLITNLLFPQKGHQRGLQSQGQRGAGEREPDRQAAGPS